MAKDPAGIPSLVPSLVMGRLGIAFLLCASLALLGLLVAPQPEGAIIAACSFTLLFRAGNVRWAWLGLSRPLPVALSRAAGEALTALLIVGLVRGIGDLGVVPVAQVAGDALAATVLAILLARLGYALPAAWRRDIAMPVFRAARPLVLQAMLALLIFNCDLIVLRIFRDASAVGRYAAAYALISFLSNLGVSFGYSLLPAFAQLEKDEGGQSALHQMSLAQAAAITLPLAVGGIIVAPRLVELVFGPSYAASVLPLRILLVSIVPAWLRTTAQMALVARGRQDDVLRVTAIAAGLTLVLDLALIPRWGVAAAAAVTVATETVRAVLLLGWGHRLGLRLPSPLRFARPLIAVAVMALVVLRFADSPLPLSIGLGALTYAVMLVLTGSVRLGRSGVELRL